MQGADLIEAGMVAERHLDDFAHRRQVKGLTFHMLGGVFAAPKVKLPAPPGPFMTQDTSALFRDRLASGNPVNIAPQARPGREGLLERCSALRSFVPTQKAKPLLSEAVMIIRAFDKTRPYCDILTRPAMFCENIAKSRQVAELLCRAPMRSGRASAVLLWSRGLFFCQNALSDVILSETDLHSMEGGLVS